MIRQRVNIDGRGPGLYLGQHELGERFIGWSAEGQVFARFARLENIEHDNGRTVFTGPYWEFGYMKFSEKTLVGVQDQETRNSLERVSVHYDMLKAVLEGAGIPEPKSGKAYARTGGSD